MCDWVPRKFIEILKRDNLGYAQLLETLWFLSKSVHEHQNESGNPNQNGRLHVRMVEYNMWRFISESHNIEKINPNEIFFLSAAACTHDFDKAQDLPSNFEHGQGSADFLIKNHLSFGLDRTHAQAIGRIIEIHNYHGQQFVDKLKAISIHDATSLGVIDSQKIALLLKVADLLHLDESRVLRLIEQSHSLGEIKKQVISMRGCVAGWIIDGTRVIIQAIPVSQQERDSLYACYDWMKKNEWEPIKEYLRSRGFPSELVLSDEGNGLGGSLPLDSEGIHPLTRVDIISSGKLPKAKLIAEVAMKIRIELNLEFEGIKRTGMDSISNSFSLELLGDFVSEIKRCFIKESAYFKSLGVETVVVNSEEINLLADPLSADSMKDLPNIRYKASLQAILESRRKELSKTLCDIYAFDHGRFKIVVQNAGFDLSQISGQNFCQEVNSFLNICMYHTGLSMVKVVFKSIVEDCPEITIFRETYVCLDSI